MNIVGAGAAGLSLALMVPGSHVYEKEDEPGGLCRSTVMDGFTFDLGPHILGGIPEAVAWVVESSGVEFVEGQTRNVGWLRGDWTAHPFEDHRVGRAYMAKMWKHDPDLLGMGLHAQKGRKPGGVSNFLYPAHGGYAAIVNSWARQLEDRVTYGVTCEEGDDVWTGPVRGGIYNTLTTVTAGFVGAAPPLTAIYLPEAWTPFHRLSFPSNFAPSNAPRGCFSVQGEVSGDAQVGTGALWETLGRIGIRPLRCLFNHVETTRHAYPVPVTQPDTPRGHGRTGSLRYLNVDGVVAQSMARAGALV